MSDPVQTMSDGDVRRLVEEWGRRTRLLGHTRLELANATHRGHRPGDPPPLAPGDPVPGCACLVCATLVAGGGWDDGRIAAEVVWRLSKLHPNDRHERAERAVAEWAAHECILPAAGGLVVLAGQTPGAVCRLARRRLVRRRDPLPVDSARRVPILHTCERLGLDLRRVGRSWRGPCPFHGGEHNNFSVAPAENLFHCFVCGAGGDGIALVMGLRGLTFVDAVRELAP